MTDPLEHGGLRLAACLAGPDGHLTLLVVPAASGYGPYATLGYVLKEAADDELVEAVRRAAVGKSYLTPRLGARIASEPPPRAAG